MESDQRERNEGEGKNYKELYNALLADYSENVIIQSMNDMKKSYILLESELEYYKKDLEFYKKNTVPIAKYTEAIDKTNKHNNLIKFCQVMVGQLKRTHSKLSGAIYDKKVLAKLEMEIIVLENVLTDSN